MRYFLDTRTGEWLTRKEWDDKYDDPTIYSAVRGGKLPRGIKRIETPATYGKSSHFRDGVLHVIDFAVEGTYNDAPRLGARYMCGENTVVLKPVVEPGDERQCPRCFNEKKWHVYAYWNAAGDTLYVGQTSDLSHRRTQHRSKSTWLSESVWHDVLSTHDTAAEALAAEREAIRRYRPLHNVHHVPKEAVA